MKSLYLASSIADSGAHIAKKVKPKHAAFIITAGEPEKEKGWIDDDRNGLNKAGISTFDYTLTGKTPANLERDLGGCDLIHVNGGNDFYLLLQAKKSGFDQFINKQVNKGVIYIGSSAGSAVAAPDIAIASFWESDRKYLAMLPDTQGLNLVDFIVFPHWASELYKDLYAKRLADAYQKGNKIILLNDDQYVEVKDDHYRIVDVTKE